MAPAGGVTRGACGDAAAAAAKRQSSSEAPKPAGVVTIYRFFLGFWGSTDVDDVLDAMAYAVPLTRT